MSQNEPRSASIDYRLEAERIRAQAAGVANADARGQLALVARLYEKLADLNEDDAVWDVDTLIFVRPANSCAAG